MDYDQYTGRKAHFREILAVEYAAFPLSRILDIHSFLKIYDRKHFFKALKNYKSIENPCWISKPDRNLHLIVAVNITSSGMISPPHYSSEESKHCKTNSEILILRKSSNKRLTLNL